MATRSSRYLPALKAASSIVEKRATPGEKVMGRLFPNRGIGYPGGWSADRIKQVQHMTDWTYVAVHTICMKIASVMPNLAFVSPVRRPGLTVKACQRSLFNSLGKGFGGTPYIASNFDYGNSVSPASFTKGRYGSPDPDYGVGSFGGSYTSYMTVGEWKSKALSVVKPQDELEPLPSNHLLRRLIENPNPYDTHFDYRYELMMFKLLCGVAYEWIIPNAFGQPCERWVLPSHWVWPRTGGSQFVDPEDPNADKLIQYYEVRPWGGLGSAGMLRLPPDQVVVHLFKSPINKLDGYSKLWAISRWIDTEESISNSRWAQFINQARPEFWVELGPGFNDPDDNMIARWEAKIAQKHQGEFNMGRPIMTPAGAKVTPLSFNPTEMAYHQSEEQIRDMILSGFGVPKSAVGVVSDMTFGSVLATLMSFCEQCLNPLLAQEGQVETKHLGARFDEGDRRCKIWYDNLAPADPAQVNSDLQLDLQAYSVTPNEIRILRGREPYRIGGDNPIVNGPGGPMPLPINVEERMDDLGELVSLYTDQVAGKKDAEKLATMQSNETLSQDEVRDAGSNGDAGGDADVGLPGDTGGASRPTSEELSSGGKVEEPNGKPRKRYAKSVNPSLVDLFKRAKTMEPGEAMDKARVIVANMTDVDIKDSFAAAGGYLAGKGHKKLRESAIREIGELSLASYRNQIIDRIIPIKSVKKSAPIAAGLAVVAEDTGRVLMLQRAIDVDDSASGMWEFPGGHIEAGENVADAAKREWAEEVGVTLPDVDVVEGWRSEDGRYVGFVATVPSEIGLMERDEVSNPDGDRFEAVAWIAPEHVSQMPIRDELAEQVDDFEALANVKEWVSNEDGGVVPSPSEAVPSIVDKGFDVAKLYNEQRMLVESWVTK